MAVVLLASSTATGGLTGFVAGLAWALTPWGPLPTLGLAVLAAAALVADVLHARTGRLRPLAVGHQVPTVWSQLFAPETVALLYGARLGVGPLTILRTWLWWALLIGAAAAGPGVSAGMGALFGAARVAAMVLTAEWVRHDAPTRMGRLQRAEGRAGIALGLLVVAGALLLAR